MPRRSKKEIERIEELAELTPCTECAGQGVYKADFKYWKTCPECKGKKYI